MYRTTRDREWKEALWALTVVAALVAAALVWLFVYL